MNTFFERLSWLRQGWIIILIVLLGLFLRIYGFDWGKPLLLHPDEPVIMDQAYDLIKRGSWEPLKYYGTPDHLSIYGMSLVMRVVSPLAFHKQAIETFPQNTQFYYYVGRILTAVVGTLTIVLAYLIGMQFGRLTGLFSALFFSIFPLYVLHGHYVTPDVPLTFLTTLVMYLLVRFIKSNKQKYIWIATIVAALSVTEKYPAVANFGMCGLVYLLTNKQKIWKFLIKGMGLVLAFLTTLFVSAPFIFIRYQRTIDWFTYEARSDHLGVQVLGFFGNIWFYMTDFYTNGGLIISVLFLLGIGMALKQRKVLFIPLLIGLVYWLGLSKVALHETRWALPMYLTPLLFAAYALDVMLTKFKGTFFFYVLLILIQISLMSHLILDRRNLIKQTALDTRVANIDVLKNAGITPENTLSEWYTTFGLRSNITYDLKQLKDPKIKYVMLSSNMFGKYLKEDPNGPYKKNIDFYNYVSSKKMVQRFQQKCLAVAFKSFIPELDNILSTIDPINCKLGPEIRVHQI